MSLFSALNISLSGLQAVQTQMQLVANNISNSGQVGYTRKEATLTAATLGTVGGGVSVSGFTRSTDSALSTSLNAAMSESGFRAAQSDYLTQVQTILGSNNSSNPPISGAVSDFASAWTELQAEPESNIKQQAVIYAATTLTSRLQNTASDIEGLDRQCKAEIDSTLTELNSYLAQVGNLNQKISQTINAGQSAGNLQDQRDTLVQKIAAITDITVLERPHGEIAVFTSSGYALVDCGQAQSFSYNGSTVSSALDPSTSLNDVLAGGKLQALVNFRATTSPASSDPATSVIQKLRSQLDAIATAFTNSAAGPPQTFANAYDQTASVSIASNCLNIRSKNSGTFGNGISVTLSSGTIAGTTRATIHVAGQSDEVFDNVSGTGNALWTNLATAINSGSRLVAATAGTGTTAPTLTSYTLTGGDGGTTNGVASNTLLNNGIASATVQSGALNLRALASGAAGDAISLSIADGSVPGTNYTVTLTNGTTTETYTDVSGVGNAFWTNLATAISGGWAGPPAQAASTLLSATAGTSVAAPTSPSTTTLTGGDDTTSTSAMFTALTNGTSNNGITVRLVAGTNAGTFRAIVTSGTTVETYDNIDNSGSGFWTNLANAINTAPSGIVMVTTGAGTSLPTVPQTLTLTGGTDELQSNFFTGTDRTNFAINANLKNGTATMKTDVPEAVNDSFNNSTKSFTADGLSVSGSSYSTLVTSILTGFQAAASNISELSNTATDMQEYLQQRLTNATGVNVDTETASLTTLENAYAASANVMSVVQRLFDSLEELI